MYFSILKIFTLQEIREIAIFLSKFYSLTDAERIFHLILQVDSIDIALHLLNIHKDSELTIDFLVYSYLHHIDNLEREI